MSGGYYRATFRWTVDVANENGMPWRVTLEAETTALDAENAAATWNEAALAALVTHVHDEVRNVEPQPTANRALYRLIALLPEAIARHFPRFVALRVKHDQLTLEWREFAKR